jgi:hypothetical protein
MAHLWQGHGVCRQDAILGERPPGVYPDAPPAQVHLVIGQAALYQQVGGAGVMEEQLSALARAAVADGRVTVQVLLSGCGAHAVAGDGSLEPWSSPARGSWGSSTGVASVAACAWRGAKASPRTRRRSSNC